MIPLEKLGPWIRLGRVEEPEGLQKWRWRPVLEVPSSQYSPGIGRSSKTRPSWRLGPEGRARRDGRAGQGADLSALR